MRRVGAAGEEAARRAMPISPAACPAGSGAGPGGSRAGPGVAGASLPDCWTFARQGLSGWGMEGNSDALVAFGPRRRRRKIAVAGRRLGEHAAIARLAGSWRDYLRFLFAVSSLIFRFMFAYSQWLPPARFAASHSVWWIPDSRNAAGPRCVTPAVGLTPAPPRHTLCLRSWWIPAGRSDVGGTTLEECRGGRQ